MKILISAAETSSDLHGAELIKSLRELVPDQKIEIFGIGGPHLRELGLRSIVPTEDVMTMGATEILRRLPRILRAMNEIVRAARTERPDFALVLDYPDFHFRLAKKLKKIGIPVLYFIPPKVWVWRTSRIHKIRELFQKVLLIFPFEKDLYERNGVPSTYVGNPVLDELPQDRSRSTARSKKGIRAEEYAILLQVGSRPSEIHYHLNPILDAMVRITETIQHPGGVCGLMSFPKTVDLEDIQSRIEKWKSDRAVPGGKNIPFRLELSQGDAHLCMLASDVGIVKSGTSTLEAALLGLRHIVVYNGARLTFLIFDTFFGYKGPVGLSNLFTDWKKSKARSGHLIFRECLSTEMNAKRVSDEIIDIYSNKERRKEIDSGLEEVQSKIRPVQKDGKSLSPSQLAASEVLDFYYTRRVSNFARNQGVYKRWISFAWSAVNWIRGLIPNSAEKVNSRVISIGNIQAGGTGKTPLTIHLAKEARRMGKSVWILTRGYKSVWETAGGVIEPGGKPVDPKFCGDEAALLQQELPFCWIGVGASRKHQYSELKRRVGSEPDILLLDDGFQNRQFQKDLELVALTSRTRSEAVYRDWDRSLEKADLLIWTKGSLRPKVPKGVPLVRVDYGTSGDPGRSKIWLITGVGDSVFVRETIERQGYQVDRHFDFPDHVVYTADQVRSLMRRASEAFVQIALTTKDWVKWKGLGIAKSDDLIVLEPTLEFVEGKEIWNQKLWGSSAPRSLQ